MFLRKIFSSKNKLTWVLIDLLIVIIGVYCAFLIQNYALKQRDHKERIKVLSELKYELEYFRTILPGRATYAANRVSEWKSKLDQGLYVDFSNWIFIPPQRNYKTIEYALGIENTEVIDYRLFNQLQSLFVTIKSLESAETLIMETSRKYKPLHEKMTPQERLNRGVDNMENYEWFIRFFESRAENLGLVATRSVSTLKIINAQLGPVRRKEIESELMKKYLPDYDSKEEAVAAGQYAFPNFTEEEIGALYDEINPASELKSTTESDSISN